MVDVLCDESSKVSLHYTLGDNLIEFEQRVVDGFTGYYNTEKMMQ